MLNYLESVIEGPEDPELRDKRRIYKALLNMRKSGESRRTRFIFKIISKGLFGYSPEERDYNKSNAMMIANQVDKIITVLNNKEGDNWDFHFVPEFYFEEGRLAIKRFKIDVVIRYPWATVENSQGYSWDIEELFFLFELTVSNGNLVINSLRGSRGALHVNEIHHSYYHSHLRQPMSHFNSSEVFSLRELCLGESEAQDLIERLVTPIEDFNPDLFEAFLYSLDTIVAWESLEGVPYAYISDISDIVGEDYDNYTVSPNYLLNQEGFIRLMDSKILQEESIRNLFRDLDFAVQEDRIIVCGNRKLEKLIYESFVNHENHDPIKGSVLYFTQPNSQLYFSIEGLANAGSVEKKVREYINLTINPSTGEFPHFYFRGEKITFRVYHDYSFEEEEEIDIKLEVHPLAIKILKKHYENILFTETIKNFTPNTFRQ